MRRFRAVGSRVVDAGARGVWGNAAIKLVGGSVAVSTTVVWRREWVGISLVLDPTTT